MLSADHSDGFPPVADEVTSVLLRRVLAELPTQNVRIGHVVRQLRRRSFGGLFILLAILGLLPGISAFAGLAMIVPGVQLARGLRAPLLPRVVRRRVIDRDVLQAFGAKALPWLDRVERLVRPRWLALTFTPMPSVIGCIMVGLASVIILPLPFSNLPPAIAIFCLSLGMLERDGVLIGIGLLCSAIALAIGVAISVIAVKATLLLVAY